MPATKVPCPRPSPLELFGRVVRLTSCFTRVPMSKSGRFLSMPESTIAIVGNCAFVVSLHIGRTPDAVGQTWFEVGSADSFTCES
jgi:hypothetical protein